MQKKSAFFTFVLACLPGAGQMYLGYMRRGLSIMTVFWGIIFLAAFLSFGLLCLLLPVIWAFAFFDTFNLRSQTPEQHAAHPDAFLVDPALLLGDGWKKLVARRHTLFGGLLIFFGLYTLYNTFVEPLLWQLSRALGLDWLRSALANLPALLVAVLLIFAGVRLVRGDDAANGPEYPVPFSDPQKRKEADRHDGN